ncbi:hypothetical protein B0T19DRAFT_232889 [Cercophora scortea]|uniref:Hypervirulence associated protein TUDOR domain-containing protein n=1 Tax=Cercophora scortea TaxID=314031 RepID=A0AAE0MB40_9PEZI|nr:hypothetical protein B0T19DRAFT_232889 [Cercophora scortea]
MAEQAEPEVGDKVSWNWGNSHPAGTVAEVAHEGDISIKTQRGNTVKKNADAENPAVRIERSGNDVVKRASELTVDQKGDEAKTSKDSDDAKDKNGEGTEKTADAGTTKDEKKTDMDKEEDASDTKKNGNEETEPDPHVITNSGKEVKRDSDAAKEPTDETEATKGAGDPEQNGIVLRDDEEAGEEEYEPEEPVSEEDGEEDRAAAAAPTTRATDTAAEDTRKRKAPESEPEPEQVQDEKKARV